MGPSDVDAVLAIGAAALGGAAVGVERQWSGHATGPAARFGGIRTFTLLGAVAGMSGWLWRADAPALGAFLVGATAALVVAAYVAASRRDVDGTTEVAALVVLGAGVLDGLGELRLASGVVAVTCLLLVEKSRLHALVARIDDVGLRAGARFAVMAVVVLPLLPTGPYGPLGGVRPRQLWSLVLLFSGLSFAGYVARRAAGPGRGHVLAGLLGGIVSSTSVTLAFARASRDTPGLATSLALGTIAASTVMFARLLVATALLHPPLAVTVAPVLLAPVVVGLALVLVGARRIHDTHTPTSQPANPLGLVAALQMAALFQLVLVAVEVTRRQWGDVGLLATSALVGSTDTDALTLAVSKAVRNGISRETGALALALGSLANTAFKLGAAVLLGEARFWRRAATGLAALAAAVGAALALVR